MQGHSARQIGARVLGVAVVLLGAACREPQPDTEARLSGHVEATDIRIAAEVGGRITELLVDQGSRVTSGDVVARLDTTDTSLAIRRAEAERAQADAQLRLLLAGSRQEDIRQAEALTAAAIADVQAAHAERQSAAADLERFEELLRRNSGSRKQRDDAATRLQVAEERVRSGEERVRASRETVARLKAGARAQEVDAARARIATVDAQMATLQEAMSDAVVKAPASGVVTEKLVESGELIAPRTPVAVLTDLDHAWANLYIDEPSVPRIRLGQSVQVSTDAGDTVSGTIAYISPRAEFTPRNVQTAQERSKLVYRIKVTVDNRDGKLKPGMPVEARVALQPSSGATSATPGTPAPVGAPAIP